MNSLAHAKRVVRAFTGHCAICTLRRITLPSYCGVSFLLGSVAYAAAPTLTAPAVSNVGASQVTLTLTSSETGRGYFTLLTGGATPGTGAQTKAGQDGTGTRAHRFGSLPLMASTAGTYTVRNLPANTSYTVCFTADDGTLLQPTVVTATFTTPATANLSGAVWTGVGNPGVFATSQMVSLAFSPDGAPVVGYSDRASGHKATVASFDGTDWRAVAGGISTGSSGLPSLAFAPDGAPWVAFLDGDQSQKVTVMRYVRGAWSRVGLAGFTTGGAAWAALTFGHDGTPYVACHDLFGGYKATVLRYDSGSDSWSAVGGSGVRAEAPALAVAPDGSPCIVYADFDNGEKATVKKFDGSVWQPLGRAGFSATPAYELSLAFAPDGTPYVAYRDANGNKGMVMSLNGGGEWNVVGSVAFSTSISHPSIAVAPDGTPYVAFTRGSDGRAMVMKFSGGAWQGVGAAGFSADYAANLTMAFRPDGVPFVAYRDFYYGDKATVMKFEMAAPSPTVASVNVPAAGTYVSGDALNFTVNFSAAVNVTSTPRIAVTIGSATRYATYTSGSGTSAVVFRYTVQSGDSGSIALASSIDLNGGTMVASSGGTAVTLVLNGVGSTGGVTVVSPPTLTVPTISNLGANQATFTFTSSASGTGYFTLLKGSATPGSGAQTKAGKDGTGAPAHRFGSLSLAAWVAGTYTVRELNSNWTYTVCFTADDGTTLQPTVATATFTTAVSADLAGTNWAAVGGAGFTGGGASELTLAFSPQGVPHLAFRDNASGGKATVMAFNGSAWTTIGVAGFSPDIPNDLNLAFAPDGRPHVAFADYAHGNKASVMRFDGSAWTSVGVANFSAGAAGDVWLAFAPDGAPWVSFCEPANNFKATIMRFDGTGWNVVGSAGFSLSSAGDMKLAFAPDGTPHVAYRDDGRGSRATVMKFDGSDWTTVGAAGFSPGGAYFISLAFANGLTHVAYSDFANGAKGTAMALVDGTWAAIGPQNFTASEAKYLSLSFAPNGRPWIAFRDLVGGTHTASVMKWEGGWSVVGDRGISGGGVTEVPLAFSPNGVPYIAFSDNPTGKATVMKLEASLAPAVASVGVPAAGTYMPGDSLDFTVNFSTAVHVTGTPRIAATIGSTTRYATYVSGSGTTALVFRYTLQAGDAGGIALGSAIDLNGGTIAGASGGTAVTLALNGVGSTGGVTVVSPPTVTAPTISNLGANQVTLVLTSSATGTGYFTLLTGGAVAGTGAQTKAGRDNAGTQAFRFGSLPLTASTAASYTIRNLISNTSYRVCFTADDGATLQPTVATASFTTSASSSLNGFDWSPVGAAFSTGTADYEVLTFDPSGAPYVAFHDYDLAHKITVKKFDGTSWTTVGSPGFSDGAADFIALAFAPEGTAYVAFKDDGHGYRATVMKLAGNAWISVGPVGFSSGQACDHSLAFAPDGVPHLAFRDVANGQKATVMKFAGSAWTAVGSAGFTDGAAYDPSLAFAPDGTLHLAFEDDSRGGKATVMKFDGTNWVVVGTAGFSTGTVDRTTLAFSPDGTSFVAYQDYAATFKVTVNKFVDGVWSPVGGAGFSAGQAQRPSLAIAPDGKPCVAFMDATHANKATMMKFNGAAWDIIGTAGFSGGSAGFPSLGFAPNGTPYFAFKDNGNGGRATVMKLTPSSGIAPTIAWSQPADVIYGTPLSVTQLNASASVGEANVPGTFTYNPTVGTVLNAGANQTLSVTFTPADPVTYSTATATTTITVRKASQTITFGVPPAKTLGEGPFALSASASSGLPVSFTSWNSAVATISGTIVTLVGAGSTTITASQPGNANYHPASDVTQTLSVSVTQPPPVESPPPSIVAQPTSQEVIEGASIKFTVVAEGASSYQWRRNGADIPGARSNTLTLANVTTDDSGSYSVLAWNAGGSVLSETATLHVTAKPIDPPAITVQPAAQHVDFGGSARFSVAAVGSSLGYQWFKDATPIAGATEPMLTMENIQPSEAGSYHVVVSNAAGSVTSNSVVLVVADRKLADSYFGTFGLGANGGTFALFVRPDRTAVFLGYDPAAKAAFVECDVSVDAKRSFRLVTRPAHGLKITPGSPAPADLELTIEGTILGDGAIFGRVTGSTGGSLTAPPPASSRICASMAGFYQAGCAGDSAISYTIVGATGDTYVITIAGTSADAGKGTVTAAGDIGVTTDNGGSVVGSIDPPSAMIGIRLQPPSGSAHSFLGANNDARDDFERFINTSTRGLTGAGNVLIAGFAIGGNEPKPVLVRAIGPTLRSSFRVINALSAARLEVFKGSTSIAVGNDWDAAADAVAVARAAAAVGAFPLPNGSRDAALVLTLDPGSYTAVVTGQGGAGGVALVEVYDAAPGDIPRSQRMINLSTRATAGTGENALIAGFVITGSVPKRVLVRGAGPSLMQFPGIGSVLARPQVAVMSGNTLLAQNTGWSNSADATAIAAAVGQIGAFPFAPGSEDAALIVNLLPGAYTAQVTGAGAGVALVEIYEVP